MSSRLARIQHWEQLAREAQFRPAVMAAACSVSLRQLERFFLHHFKKTPNRWTRELRCGLATKLVASGWSNKAVAKELFFANESHLCHEFKKLLAAPPQFFAPHYGRGPLPAWPPAGGPAPAPAMSSLDNKVAIRQ